jgi:hypothetical protein
MGSRSTSLAALLKAAGMCVASPFITPLTLDACPLLTMFLHAHRELSSQVDNHTPLLSGRL